MDHQEQHHQHHRKEREHEKAIKKLHERQEAHKTTGIHPGWFVVLGTALVVVAVLVWTFVL